MTPRGWWQTSTACLAVGTAGGLHLILTPAHPSHIYPWPINALVLSTVALSGYTAGGAAARRREKAREERARRTEARQKATAIVEAADLVITARPADDYNGLTCTPQAVREYLWVVHGRDVPPEDCAAVLADRLYHRGFAGPPASSNRSHQQDPAAGVHDTPRTEG